MREHNDLLAGSQLDQSISDARLILLVKRGHRVVEHKGYIPVLSQDVSEACGKRHDPLLGGVQGRNGAQPLNLPFYRRGVQRLLAEDAMTVGVNHRERGSRVRLHLRVISRGFP